MPRIHIKNCRIILKEGILKDSAVTIDGHKIASVGKKAPAGKGVVVIDARDAFVSAGFIDCHIHGMPDKIFYNEAKHGLTSFVVAQSCAPLESIYKKAGRIKEFIESDPLGPNVLGVRLEGPYISKKKAGAQDKSCIRTPDVKELSGIIQNCKGLLRIMTVAPELKNALTLIRLLCKSGVIASIGHSDANFEAALEGVNAGITHATHTFNAMSGVDRREPGVVGAVLMDDRVTAEVILDLIHVHRALFSLLVKIKGGDRVVVVTDSLAALEINRDSPIKREIGVLGQSLFGGAYRFQDGRLAGSALTMIGALKNAVIDCGLPLADAARLITLNPARLLGVEERKGAIAADKDADIVVFDDKFRVKMTIINGRIIYENFK